MNIHTGKQLGESPFEQEPNLTAPSLTFIGDDLTQGSYVLRIGVRGHLGMSFGRFKRGKLIDVQPGDYIYVGSAMARSGSTCLAQRLLRHATRSGNRRPHPMRSEMLTQFPREGLAYAGLRAPSNKTLRWHVDYLLDENLAELACAFVVRSMQGLESNIADMLELDIATTAIEKGLGATDRSGHTHLLRVEGDDTWWKSLPEMLDALRANATA